jgi:hypothetical protein
VGFGLSNKILPYFPICHQLSPSSLNPSSFFLCPTFVTISFLLCGVVSSTPNPQPGGPGYPFFLVHHPGMGGPTSSIHYRQHSSWDHVATQAPPLRQIRDTFGGGGMSHLKILYYLSILFELQKLHPFFFYGDFMNPFADSDRAPWIGASDHLLPSTTCSESSW